MPKEAQRTLLEIKKHKQEMEENCFEIQINFKVIIF